VQAGMLEKNGPLQKRENTDNSFRVVTLDPLPMRCSLKHSINMLSEYVFKFPGLFFEISWQIFFCIQILISFLEEKKKSYYNKK
jgi:hypothetical protein